jgi:precorrin-2 methylase
MRDQAVHDVDHEHVPSAAITIIGAGLAGHWQLTCQACQTLAGARVIYLSRYSRDLPHYVREVNPRADIVDIDAEGYAIGDYRPAMYARMAARILDDGAAGPGVVLLEPGSAVVTDLVTQLLCSGADRRGISVSVVPGISSIEAVLSDLQYDISVGLQIVQAQMLVLYRQRLNPAIAAMIIQPGYYDTLWWVGFAQSKPARFQMLRDQLAESYDADRPMVLLRLRPVHPFDMTFFWFRLENLTQLYGYLSPLHTLFIPPAAEQPMDRVILDRVRSWSEALKAVECDPQGRPRQKHPRYWFEEDLRGLPISLVEQSRELAGEWRGRWKRANGYVQRFEGGSESQA